MRIISRRFLKIMVKSSMWSSPWIGWSIFPVGMDMLSSRIELMQRRLFFTWMVAKLMEMLLKSDSRFHHSSKELLLLQKLFTLHQKGMWLIIIKLVLVLKRPPNSSPGNHLLKESQLHLQEGDLLQVEELNHLGVGLILLQFAVEQLPLQSGVVELLAGDQDPQSEGAHPLRPLED